MRSSFLFLSFISSAAFTIAGNVSPSGRCGGGRGYSCIGSDDGPCCSQYGWCGDSREYCGRGCQSAFGRCWGDYVSSAKPSSKTSSTKVSSSKASSKFSSIKASSTYKSSSMVSSVKATSSIVKSSSASASPSSSIVLSSVQSSSVQLSSSIAVSSSVPASSSAVASSSVLVSSSVVASSSISVSVSVSVSVPASSSVVESSSIIASSSTSPSASPSPPPRDPHGARCDFNTAAGCQNGCGCDPIYTGPQANTAYCYTPNAQITGSCQNNDACPTDYFCDTDFGQCVQSTGCTSTYTPPTKRSLIGPLYPREAVYQAMSKKPRELLELSGRLA